ncbi:hypothetical protein HPC49_23430 [Pyxidicoccus fallax]|uniref:TIR domain-containing protein n=1 Tax=Pyxidicoccus fallax TaxID=394095 RepID=A0A848LCX2_9BACT|nr:hypothetical protein [Pyxidicoccus fallax]NMO16930.1 hypothetical protein [Pyxidicoccus fallax]NPC81167.1 hypothetical protein [Pyxidicoccus fallax]
MTGKKMDMGRIFVSYRREDCAGEAGRLHDHLGNHFGPEQVFRDIDAIEIGVDFVDAINSAILLLIFLVMLSYAL